MIGSDWDGLVVVCAGTNWDAVWSSEKHIAHRLAQYAKVLYVDPPISKLTPRRNADIAHSLHGPRLRVVHDSLARLTPVVLPGVERKGMHLVATALTRRAIGRAVRALGTPSVRAVIVASPRPLFGACGERLRVLYATDDFVAAASLMGLPEARLRRYEVQQAAQADVVVTISPSLADKWLALGHTSMMITNGCDDRLFDGTDDADHPTDVDLPPPIAGFIGHLSERIDLALLEAVARRGHSLLLVGPRQGTYELRRMEALLARPNVQWVGGKPFEVLPSYVRTIDVGLTPYADTAFNRASFPLKTLEYLAGGRAVVSADLPAARWLNTDLISIASDPELFADAVEHGLQATRTSELIVRRRAFATQHSWSSRTIDFARVLGIDTASQVNGGVEAPTS